MAKKLFKSMPVESYQIDDKTYQLRNYFDIHKMYKVVETYSADPRFYTTVTVEDGMKWETLSQEVYNDKNAFWVIMLLNSGDDVFYDWAMTVNELLLSTHYNDPTKAIENRGEQFGKAVVLNDANRELKVLRPEFLADFEFKVFDSLKIKKR